MLNALPPGQTMIPVNYPFVTKTIFYKPLCPDPTLRTTDPTGHVSAGISVIHQSLNVNKTFTIWSPCSSVKNTEALLPFVATGFNSAQVCMS